MSVALFKSNSMLKYYFMNTLLYLILKINFIQQIINFYCSTCSTCSTCVFNYEVFKSLLETLDFRCLQHVYEKIDCIIKTKISIR